jgi:hypothetical protein
VLEVVRDHSGHIQDMGYSQVVQDLGVRCMKLVSQVETALQDLVWVILSDKGARVEARSTEFTKLGISIGEHIERISAEIYFSYPLVLKCLNQ